MSKQKYCHTCEKATRWFNPKRVNHVLHGVLTVCTMGFWAIVWLILWLIANDKGYECINCGTSE